MQSMVLSRESISSEYAIVIPVRPLFATSSFTQSTGIHSDTVIGTALRRTCGASCIRLCRSRSWLDDGSHLKTRFNVSSNKKNRPVLFSREEILFIWRSCPLSQSMGRGQIRRWGSLACRCSRESRCKENRRDKKSTPKNYCNLNFGRFNSISISAERRNNISFAPAPGNLNQDFQFLAAAEEPIFLGGGAGYNVKTVLYNWLAASNHCSGAAHHIIYIYIIYIYK